MRLGTGKEKQRCGFSRGLFADIVLIALLSAAAAGYGYHYLNTWEGRAAFYQRDFGPAVLVAAGQGFANPDLKQHRDIAAFLALEKNALSSRELEAPIATMPLEQWHGLHYYALWCVGLLWRVTGVHWGSVHLLLAAMLALCAGCIFALCRLFANRFLSLLAAILSGLSPGYLYILPQFRDFSKAPFTLAVLALLFFLLSRRRKRYPAYLGAALLGGLIGLGLGFRQDLVSWVPVSAGALSFFLPGRFRDTWARRAGAVALLLLCFAVLGSPVLQTMRRDGANSYHFMLLGLASPFNTNLGVGDIPYEFGAPYQDEYAHTLVASYAFRALGREEPLPYLGREYDQAGQAFLLHTYLRRFPADFLARWYTSIYHILAYGPFAINQLPEDQLGDARLIALMRWRWTLFGFLCGWGPFLLAGALLAISIRDLRLAFLLAGVLLYCLGLPSIQFMQRHYFHLEAIFWAVFAFWIQRGCSAARALIKAEGRAAARAWLSQPRRWWCPETKRLSIFFAVCLIGLILPLSIARGYQQNEMRNLYQRYADVPLRALTAKGSQSGAEVLVEPEGLFPAAGMTEAETRARVQTGLLAADFLPEEFPYDVRFVYHAANPKNDFSQSLTIPARRLAGSCPLRIFFQVYNAPPEHFIGERRFAGVAMPAPYVQNLKALHAVDDIASLPVLMNLRLPEDRNALPKYLRWADAPRLLPYAVRARWARSENLLENAGFERWDTAQPAPDGSTAPGAYSTIARETGHVFQGRVAIRQVWTAPDAEAPVKDHLCIRAEMIRGGALYELFLAAENATGNPLALAAWQRLQEDSGKEKQWLLHPRFCTIPPAAGYREASGQFQSLDVAGTPALCITPVAYAPSQGAGYALWDDFRLIDVTANLLCW